nr:odorant receptor 49b-like [Halyomorpha halys]
MPEHLFARVLQCPARDFQENAVALEKEKPVRCLEMASSLIGKLVWGFVKFAEGDIMQNLFTIFAAGPGMVGLGKFLGIVFYRKQIKSVWDRLSAMISEADNPKLEHIARNSLKRTWILFIVYLSIFTASVTDWLMRPPAAAILYHKKARIVDTWPVFLDTWLQWFLSYLLQFPAIVLLGHSNYTYEILYFCTSEVILCHFKLLNYKLKHLVLRDNKESTEKLISCVKYHQNLLSVCNDFKNSTSKVLIWQFLNTVIMLCTGIFILTVLIKQTPYVAVINLFEVCTFEIMSLYLYCWYSNEITFQCSDVSNAVYMAEWINAKPSDKKTMLITMSKAEQPLLFGGILEIRLETFINILKTSFSFYNFLLAFQVNSTEK